MIYFDHNATTNIDPRVSSYIAQYYAEPLNPSSVHKMGRKGKAMLNSTRHNLAELLGFADCFNDYRVVFTSSGTEANNLIINNFLGHEIFSSEIEHASVKNHSEVNIIKVNDDGVIDLNDLDAKLAKDSNSPKLVSVMLANNETGIIQPIKEVAAIARKYGALIHSDCVQAVGKMEVDITALDLDFVSISAHKFGGLQGCGALIYRSKHSMQPLIIGGGQEWGLRSGSENVLAIAALGQAALLIKDELKGRIKHMKSLKNVLEKGLRQGDDKVKIIGCSAERLPNTSLIINDKFTAEIQVIAFDLKNICLSSGSACSSGKVGGNNSLKAMGYSELEAKSALRISLGMNNKIEEIEQFLTIYKEIYE